MVDVAIAPVRLAANAQERTIEAVTDSDIRGMKRLGLELQRDGALNTSVAEAMAFDAKLPPGRMHEIMDYRVTLGEVLTMAAAADTETRLWQKRRNSSEFRGEQERAQRAMAELHAYYLLGAGHALINIVGRCLALDKSLHSRLELEFSTAFPPGKANTNKHTISLSEKYVSKLKSVAAQARFALARNSVRPLIDLMADSCWLALRRDRALDFHQLRPASHGIAGPQTGQPWRPTSTGAMLKISIATPHTDNLGLADDRAAKCRGASLSLLNAAGEVDKMFRDTRQHFANKTRMLKVKFA